MRSRSPNNHTDYGSGRRGKLGLWIALGVLLLGAWIGVVVALGGGEQAGSGGGQDPSRQEERAAADSRRATNEDGAAEGAADEASEGSGSGQPMEVADEVLSQRPGGGVPEGEVAIEDKEGRSNGQRGFVSSFIGKAYGYTGKDVQAYRSGYEGYIDTATYYDSAGASALEKYASLVEDGGAENAAVLEEYTIVSGEAVEQQVAASQVEGFAPRELMESEVPDGATVSEVTYAVGNRYADPSTDEDFGKVYGEVEYLNQRLFVARSEEGSSEGGSGWTILAASSPRPTEPPKRLDPDAPKVGYEPPGGHDHHGHEHGAS